MTVRLHEWELMQHSERVINSCNDLLFEIETGQIMKFCLIDCLIVKYLAFRLNYDAMARRDTASGDDQREHRDIKLEN